jgi:hypothetical protein
VALAADLAAFNDLPVEQAVNAIGSAFRGERDPLEQFGIVLNDAQVKAAYFRRTGEEVNGTLTTQQNILGTLQALSEQGATASGAFANEQDQLGNKTQVLNARFDDFKAKIGAVLLPAFSELTGAASNLLATYEQGGVSGVWDRISDTWSGSLDSLNTTVTNWITDHLPDFSEWTRRASKWLSDAIAGDGTAENPGLVTRMQEFANGLSEATDANGERWSEIGGRIASKIAAGLLGWWKQWVTHDAWVFMADIFKDPDKLLAFATGNPLYLFGESMARTIIDGLKGALSGVWEWLAQWASDVAGMIVKGIRDGIGGIGGFIGGLFTDSVDPNKPGTKGGGSAAPIYNFSPVLNVTVPPGVDGQDTAGAIVSQLYAFLQRNGRFPFDWTA